MNVRWRASNLTTPGGQALLAVPAALALVGLVMVGVVLFAGPSSDESRTLGVELGLGTFALFAAITWLVAMRTRATVVLGWTGEALRLDVTPPGKATISYVGPFRVERGFVREAVHTGRGSLPQLVLELAVFEARGGRCVLFLRELLGAIYQPPPGWEARLVSARGAAHVLVNSLGRTNVDALERALAARPR